MCARPPRTRIEATEQIFQAVEDKIREVVPDKERELIARQYRAAARLYNLAFTDGSDHRRQRRRDPGRARRRATRRPPTMIKKLRAELPQGVSRRALLFPARRYRDADPEFRRADADRRAGAGARPRPTISKLAQRCCRSDRATIPGVVDAHIQQELDAPELLLHDRPHARAAAWPQHAARSPTTSTISLSSSEQVSPNFWTDPKERHSLLHARCRRPEYRIASKNELDNTPVATARRSASGTPIPTHARQSSRR